MNCTKNLQKSLKLIVLIGKNWQNLQKLVKNGLFDVRIKLFTLDQIYQTIDIVAVLYIF